MITLLPLRSSLDSCLTRKEGKDGRTNKGARLRRRRRRFRPSSSFPLLRFGRLSFSPHDFQVRWGGRNRHHKRRRSPRAVLVLRTKKAAAASSKFYSSSSSQSPFAGAAIGGPKMQVGRVQIHVQWGKESRPQPWPMLCLQLRLAWFHGGKGHTSRWKISFSLPRERPSTG